MENSVAKFPRKNRKPNILFIMPDDQRADFLGHIHPETVNTPNIDMLAETGVSFQCAYTASPICSPSRVSMATGREPWRYGPVLNNDLSVPPGEPTMYRSFRNAGYKVAGIGKIDLRKSDPYNGKNGERPCAFDWGFTFPREVEGKIHSCVHGEPVGPYGFDLKSKGLYSSYLKDYQKRREQFWHTAEASNDSVLDVENHIDAYIGAEAKNWLENVSTEFPWMLFVGFSGPHEPFDPPREYAERYRNKPTIPEIHAKEDAKADWVLNSRYRTTPSNIDVQKMRQQYSAGIELIDDQIGGLIDVMKRRGFNNNTIIVFTSDHGEMIGDHGMVSAMLPYEGALRIPLIVTGRSIEKGKKTNALVSLIDIYPTLCSLANIPQEDTNIDGLSFEKVLDGTNQEHRDSIISTLNEFRCLRDDRYKLIQHISSPPELYDLHLDPEENNNIASSEPDILAKLSYEMSIRYQGQTGDMAKVRYKTGVPLLSVFKSFLKRLI